MRELLRQMEQAASNDEFIEADMEFHLRLAEAAGNSVLAGILTNIRSLTRVWISRVTRAADSVAPSYQEHVPIMEALEAQDPAAAAAAMAAHLDSAGAKLARTLEAERATAKDRDCGDDRAGDQETVRCSPRLGRCSRHRPHGAWHCRSAGPGRCAGKCGGTLA